MAGGAVLENRDFGHRAVLRVQRSIAGRALPICHGNDIGEAVLAFDFHSTNLDSKASIFVHGLQLKSEWLIFYRLQFPERRVSLSRGPQFPPARSLNPCQRRTS